MALKPRTTIRAALVLPLLVSTVIAARGRSTATPPPSAPMLFIAAAQNRPAPLEPVEPTAVALPTPRPTPRQQHDPFTEQPEREPPVGWTRKPLLHYVELPPVPAPDQKALSAVSTEERLAAEPQPAAPQPGGPPATAASKPQPARFKPPARLPGSGPHMAGSRIISTARLDLYVGRWTLSARQIRAISDEIEQALSAAERRMGARLRARTSIGFYRPSLASVPGVRGLAFTGERRIEVYYSPGEEPWRAVAVVAHELAHQLESDYYGRAVQQRADTILHEGMATWLAGSYWLELRGAGSWRERGRQLMRSGRLLSLLRDPSGPRANDAYDGWASFVDYLISAYGKPAFDELYRSSRGRWPGSAQYRKIYGRSLDQLADDWRAWLR